MPESTLEEWVYIWLKDILPNVVKESTIRMYMETMEHHVYPVLGKLQLRDITEDTIQNWVKHMQEMTVPGTQNGQMTEGTIRNILSVLSGCMREAQKYGLIESNPCLKSAWAVKSRNVGGSQDWLSEEEMAQLEPLQIDRMRAFLKRWSVKCGMREVTPQMLRDTYAMRAVHTGAASDMIAELMGFASTRYVIRRYMPASAENKRELVNRMFEIK